MLSISRSAERSRAIRLLIRRYRQMPQIGWSDIEVLDHDVPAVLAHVCRADDWRLLAVHNLGADDAIVTLDLGPVPEGSVLRDVLDDVGGLEGVDDWWLCGPEGLIADVEAWLGGQGVAAGHIHRERFTSTGPVDPRRAQRS